MWFNKSYNSGLLYCKPGTYDCYGYDYSRFYPLILASDDFKIPTKEGKSFTLKKMLAGIQLLILLYYSIL